MVKKARFGTNRQAIVRGIMVLGKSQAMLWNRPCIGWLMCINVGQQVRHLTQFCSLHQGIKMGSLCPHTLQMDIF